MIFLNIFHPMDPFAYRVEPFINPESPKPVQIPHHKGRKRLHLEIADNLGKAAAEMKAGLMRSMKSVMSSVRRAAGWEEDQQQAQQIAEEMIKVSNPLSLNNNSNKPMKIQMFKIIIIIIIVISIYITRAMIYWKIVRTIIIESRFIPYKISTEFLLIVINIK